MMVFPLEIHGACLAERSQYSARGQFRCSRINGDIYCIA